MSHSNFTHLDEKGSASMVDVGDKPISRRTAVAAASCRMQPATAQAVREVSGPKGDVLQVARIAAIAAAKRTDELIPLCHSVPLDRVDVQFAWPSEDLLEIRVEATATGRTGVEMEALLSASIAALTVYDMCKAMDRALRIESVELLSKSGGVRGDYSKSGDH